MTEECVPLYGFLRSGPNQYAVAISYILIALPVAAGLALVAKRLKGQTSPGIAVGIAAAVLWTVLLAAKWIAPASAKAGILRKLIH